MKFKEVTLSILLIFFCFFVSYTLSSDGAKKDLYSDVFLNSFELLTKYGYSPQRIEVTTGDGYIIVLFRIPRKGPPIFLVHGIADTSDEWILLGPENSLAYQLADAGFDVWLFNSRGNRYSREHVRNIPRKQYWDFTYEEVGFYDLPAAIDHILDVTSRPNLHYIGFSQGTTVFFVMCSMRPEYNSKIKHAFLLAPVAWTSNLMYPFIKIVGPNLDFFYSITLGLGLYELYPFDPKKVLHTLNCRRFYPPRLCNSDYHISFGLMNTSYLCPDRIAVIDSHIPAGVSAKTMAHFIQGYINKRFQRFDYGSEKNEKLYSSKVPPSYNLSLVTAPVSIMASEIDWYSQNDDVELLRSKLPNIKRFTKFNKSLEFSHLEFVYGSRVKTLVNDVIVSILLDDLKKNDPCPKCRHN